MQNLCGFFYYICVMKSNKKIKSLSEQTFTLEEVRQISVNFAINCQKGYEGSFDDWFTQRVRENVIDSILNHQENGKG